MGKPKPKMEVTEYYMSVHFGICSGPIDALLGVTIKEKTAWTGVQTEPGAFAVSNKDLFGGVKKEGGIDGLVTYLPGRSDQVLPDFHAARLGRGTGANSPGYRGLASLFFTGSQPSTGGGSTGIPIGGGPSAILTIFGVVLTAVVGKLSGRQAGFYWTANSPYLPGVWATVRRVMKRSDSSTQWYPSKASIPIDAVAGIGLKWEMFMDGGANVTSILPSASQTYNFSTGDGLTHTIPMAAVGNVELRSYPGSTPVAGPVVKGGSPGAISGYNVYKLEISNPPAVYYFNNGTSAQSLTAVNETFDIQVTDGATLTYTASPEDGKAVGGYQSLELTAGGGANMNPAHMIHECLTDTTWGMGAPTGILDDASFVAAADALYAERFGLSMMWTRQAAIEDFISEILDHIQAVLFVDPATGLLTLKLIRDDYDPDALPVLTPDNADVTKFDRKLWGEIINEIIVTWTNPENEQEETIVSQDLASIAMQGGNVVSASRNYYGVRSSILATQLGRRDLRTVGAPLSSCEVEIDRSAYALRPASVVKLTWPEHGLDEVIMRVMSIDYGRPGDMTIRATLMEDVFSLDAGAYVDPTGSEWEDPSSAPEPITEARVITLPTFLASEAVAQNGGSEPVYPEVVSGILATTADTDTFAYSLQSELPLPDGSLQWTALGDNNIIGRGALAADMAAEAVTTGITVTAFTGQTTPTQGGFALIGDSGEDETTMEVCMVTAFDSTTGEFSLARGVMDTVPRAWLTGTHIWFVDGETLFEDRQVRSAGETVEYKLLSQTSQGQLTLAEAPLLISTMTERPWLPLRPANVIAYGEAWSSETALIDATERADPWVTVTWSNRNRLTEDSQILLWTDATVTPEDGQTTTIEVWALDDTLLATHDGLTGVSFDVPDASFGLETSVKVRVFSERTDADGDFVSLQHFSHWLLVNGSLRSTEAGDIRTTEGGDVRIMED